MLAVGQPIYVDKVWWIRSMSVTQKATLGTKCRVEVTDIGAQSGPPGRIKCVPAVVVGAKDSALGRITLQLRVSIARNSQDQRRSCWPPTQNSNINTQASLAHGIHLLDYI